MSRFSSRIQRPLCIIFAIANALLITFPALADGCEKAAALNTAITFSEIWRGTLSGGDEQWLRLPYRSEAASDVVALEVTRPLTDRIGVGEPLLTVCSHGLTKSGGIDVLKRSTTRQVLLVQSPSDVIFRVAPQDSLSPAGPVKVTASFAAAILVAKDTEEIEIEPEIELTGPAIFDPRVPVTGGDDHADTITHATHLEAPGAVSGEIGNAWGDDNDMFSFDLAEERIVVLETGGTTDTIGALLDASDQILTVDDDGGTGANIRLVRALLPGRYFVQVEGNQGTEGPYTLTLKTVSW